MRASIYRPTTGGQCVPLAGAMTIDMADVSGANFDLRSSISLRITIAIYRIHMGDDDQALDFAPNVPSQKFVVIFEDDASI